MKSLDKKKTGWRKITADDLKRGIDLSKSIYGFKVIETKSNKKKTEPKKLEYWEIQYRQFWQNHSNWDDSEGLDIDCTKDFIQSLIQSTREETVREIMGLECMKNEPDDDDAFAKDAEIAMDNYNRNQLRNQIKTEINSLLKK